ncbi:SRPBCC family protein [Roseibacillus ishigakijimensis]|nr:SRPBCC family protein [Roseibacillus ishigakijimensis]
MEQLAQEQFLPLSRREAWEFFRRPANLDKITPEEFRLETLTGPSEVYAGAILVHRLRLPPGLPLSWVTEITVVEEERAFVDQQRFGPFAFWHHRHSLHDAPGGTLVRDLVHWRLPLEPLSKPLNPLFIRPRLERLFAGRRERLAQLFPSPQ